MSANGSNLELALRIKADVAQAKAALQQVQTDVRGVGAASKEASAAADSYTRTASRQVQVMQQAATAGTRQAEAMQLMAKIDPVGGKLGKLDELEQSLNRLHKAGAIGAEDFTALGAILTAQRAKLTGVGKAAEEGAQGMTALFLNTSRARLELGRMLKDLATGNYGRLAQSGMTYANYTGVISKVIGAAFSPTGIAIGGLAAGVGLLTAAFIKGENESAKFAATLISVGGVAGVTNEQLHDMATSLSGATVGQAKEALLQLAATGKFTGDELRIAGQAAIDMSVVTGQSLAASVKAITALRDDPVSAIEKLNEQFHFLDTATFQQIQRLQEMGQTTAAADLAEQTYADHMRDRAEQVEASLGTIQRDWQTLKQIASEAWDAMEGIGRQPVGDRAELSSGYDALLRQRMAMADALAGGSGRVQALLLHPSLFGMSPEQLQAGIASLDHSLDLLRGGMKKLDTQADETATKQQATQRAISASKWADDSLKGFDKVADKAKATQIVVQKMWDIISTGGQLPEGVHVATGPGGGFAGPGFDYLVNKLAGITTPKGRTDHSAEQLAMQAAKAQDELTQSLISLQGQLDPTTAAYAKFNAVVKKANDDAALAKKAHGANTEAIDAQKNAIVGLAQAELDEAKAKIAAKKMADEDKPVTDLLKKAPKGYRVPPEIGGALGELVNVNKDLLDLKAWHTEAMRENEAFRAKDVANERTYQQQKAQIEQYYRQRKAEDDAAAQQVSLAMAEQGFGSLASAMGNLYGQQSKQYRAAFALQKAAAVASTLIEGPKAIGKAFGESGNPLVGFVFAATLIAEFASLLAAIRGVSFSAGGYTGPGGKYQPAGIVHAGEVVWSQGDIARAGGVGTVEAMRLRGYADGGIVHPLANAPSPSQMGFQSPSMLGADGGKPMVAVTPVTVIVHSSGDGSDVKSQQSTDNNGGQILELFIGAVAKDINNGGTTAKAMDRRWVLKRKSNSYG